MEINRINNTLSFKSYTKDDLYRLEQKLDSLQYALNPNDLNSFAKGIEKQRRIPMPLGIPPYAMHGMPAPMGMPGMPPYGPMGMYGSMGMPGMMGMPPRYGSMPPMGGMYPPSSMYGPTMGMPPSPHRNCGSNLSGQPCQDIFCPKR